MMRVVASLLIAAGLLLVVVGLARSQMIEPSVEAMESAKIIVAGRITAVESHRHENGDTWSYTTDVTVGDLRSLQGAADATTLTFTEIGGEDAIGAMLPSSYVKFKVGEEYLLFLGADGRLLHAQLGAVPVCLNCPAPDHLMLTPGQPDTRTLEQRLRDRYHLAPPWGDIQPLVDARRAERRARLAATTSCCRHWSPNNAPPWPHFVGTVKVRLPQQGDGKLGDETSRRVIENAMNAWASRSGFDWTWGAPLSGNGPGFTCGGGNELLVSWEDPQAQISPPTSCQGALAIGGFCAGPDLGDGTRQIVTGALVFADGWHSCPYADEPNMQRIGEHEGGHVIGFAHSKETNEACGTNDPACRARMYAYLTSFPMNECDDACATESYGFGGPTPSTSPAPSPSPTTTAAGATPTPSPCPPGQHYKPRNRCPYPSGKWSKRCHCVADESTVIGIGPSGCNRE